MNKGLKSMTSISPNRQLWKGDLLCIILTRDKKKLQVRISNKPYFFHEEFLLKPHDSRKAYVFHCGKGTYHSSKYSCWWIVNSTIRKGLCDDPGDNWEILDACSSLPNLAYVISEPSCWPFLTSFVKLWHQEDYVSKQF